MRTAALALAFVACTHAAWTPAPLPTPTEPSPPPATFGAGPATAVVILPSSTPTAVLAGPFLVSAINPGRGLELAIAKDSACTDRALWFEYSGGGVAVAAGEVLCARQYAHGAPLVEGFSGTGGIAAAPPAAPPPP